MSARPYLSRLPAMSLRGKITLLCCALACGVALTVGGLFHVRAAAQGEAAALRELAGEARLTALQLQAGYDTIEQDVEIIAGTPPVTGLIRSTANAGLDPLDGSGTGLWRTRLETIFASILKARPSYTQIRYIGAADGGRELVRVNRIDGAAAPVPEEALQQKAGEPYMRAVLNGRRAFFFSNLTFNREYGRRDPAMVPTIRAVMPVEGPDGEIFGAVVINVDFRAMQRALFRRTQPAHRTFLLNQAGDYVSYDPLTRTSLLEFSESPTREAPDFLGKILTSGQEEAAFADAGTLSYYVRMQVARNNGGDYIGAVVQVEREELLAEVRKSWQRSLILVVVLTVCAGAAGAVAARRFLQPLVRMTQTLRSARANGGPLDLPLSARDEIGDLARAFRKLRDSLTESEDRASAVVDNAIDGILTVAEDGTIERFNPACERMFGYTAAEVVGRNVSILMDDPDRRRHDGYLKRYLKADDPSLLSARREVCGRRKDKSLFPLELSVTEFRIGDRRLFAGILRDISHRKNAEAERERLVAALSLSNRELDDFAYVASHDLKAPLRVIDNTSRWLEEDLSGHLDEDSRENMDLLRNRVNRMEKLLDDLLEYSRIGRKLDGRASEIVSGAQLADDLVVLAAVPETFELRFTPGFDAINVPRMPLQQVLFNLISNAVKHHDAEAGIIEISVGERDGRHVFSVRDDGPGIAEKYQDQVFKMFQTLKPRDRVEGSGMGLAIVKKHVEQNGGQITLRSREGEGCCFRFSWQVLQQRQAA